MNRKWMILKKKEYMQDISNRLDNLNDIYKKYPLITKDGLMNIYKNKNKDKLEKYILTNTGLESACQDIMSQIKDICFWDDIKTNLQKYMDSPDFNVDGTIIICDPYSICKEKDWFNELDDKRYQIYDASWIYSESRHNIIYAFLDDNDEVYGSVESFSKSFGFFYLDDILKAYPRFDINNGVIFEEISGDLKFRIYKEGDSVNLFMDVNGYQANEDNAVVRISLMGYCVGGI